MAIEWIFAIVMIALAVILFGAALLFRRRSAGISAGEGAYGFSDCYELCAREAGKPASVSCSTMCSTTVTV